MSQQPLGKIACDRNVAVKDTGIAASVSCAAIHAKARAAVIADDADTIGTKCLRISSNTGGIRAWIVKWLGPSYRRHRW